MICPFIDSYIEYTIICILSTIFFEKIEKKFPIPRGKRARRRAYTDAHLPHKRKNLPPLFGKEEDVFSVRGTARGDGIEIERVVYVEIFTVVEGRKFRN